MKLTPIRRILGRIDHADLIGRDPAVERLVSYSRGVASPSLCLLAPPGAGSTEVLRQTYDRLFSEQEGIVPIYLEIRVGEVGRNLAVRFLYEFLLQAVACRRNDPNIIGASPDLREIAELALPGDAQWIDRLVDKAGREGDEGERSFIRSCLSAPLRAAAHGVRCLVMIDGLQLVGSHSVFFEELTEIASRSNSPFLLGGLRRFLFGKTQLPSIELPELTFAEAGHLAQTIAARSGTHITEQARDLLAVQMGGSPKLITFMLSASKDLDLNAFEDVQKVYTDELFGGRITRNFDSVIRYAFPDKSLELQVIRLASAAIGAPPADNKVSDWMNSIRGDQRGLTRGIEVLHNHELIDLSSGMITVSALNTAFCDYLRARVAIELSGISRAQAVGDALAGNVKRAPHLMAEYYRRNASIGLRELMLAFDGRRVSAALLDYGRFKAEFKGAKVEKILKALKASDENIGLPHIVYAAHTAHFYARIGEICETERSAVAIGFTDSSKKEGSVLISAQIDSKLEATRDLAEFWCDRLEMAAENSGFVNYKLWLIAPEGFDDEALAALAERNALGSSRQQVELLAGILNSPFSTPVEEPASDEYEITVPMGDEAELIAARTIEEIAKRHNFSSKAVNQIKTAVVEACINASEHSLSPDGKIYQRFSVSGDTLTVTVTNRGLRLTDKDLTETRPAGQRRGWGLKLMRSLMDEVTIQQTDDGTSITMTKLVKP